MARAIKVYSTNGQIGDVQSAATTFGELIPDLTRNNIQVAGMKVIVGETRAELSLDGAILPEGPFQIFLMPSKTKSGSLSEEDSANLATIARVALLWEAKELEAIKKEEEIQAYKQIEKEMYEAISTNPVAEAHAIEGQSHSWMD